MIFHFNSLIDYLYHYLILIIFKFMNFKFINLNLLVPNLLFFILGPLQWIFVINHFIINRILSLIILIFNTYFL